MRATQTPQHIRSTIWYFLLTFCVSWGGVFWASGGIHGLPADAAAVEERLPFVVLALTLGPIFSGVLLGLLEHGKVAMRDLAAQTIRWRASLKFYAVALLLAPGIAAATLAALALWSAEFVPGIWASNDRSTLLFSAAMAGLAGGLLEEPGWTWYATSRLLHKGSIFRTGLLVGLAWGAWHLIVAIWGSGTPTGEFSWMLLMPQLVFYAFVLPAYRILMVWLYQRTESLFLCMLMHASLTSSILFIFMPLSIDPGPLSVWYLAFGCVLWGIVGGMLAREKLGKR